MTTGITSAFIATWLVMYRLDQPQPVVAAPAPDSRETVATVARLRSSIRPIYPYSVVAGGVHSPEDVTLAMQRDPVVAEHYVDVHPEDLREELVERPTLVHASYRIGDKVFWTARTIALHTGEKILTDGKTTIRERCGNVLTVEPLGPALMDEPAAPEFDVAVTPWTPGAGYRLDSPPVFFDPPDPPNPPEDPPVPVVYRVDPPVPVPEPATWVLLSLGLMAAAARSLHTRRAQSQR